MNAISFKASTGLNITAKTQAPTTAVKAPELKTEQDTVSFGSKIDEGGRIYEAPMPQKPNSFMPTVMFLAAAGAALIGGAVGLGKDAHSQSERIAQNATVAMAQVAKDKPGETVIKDTNGDGVNEITYMNKQGDQVTFDLKNNTKITKNTFDDEYKEPISDMSDVKTDYKAPITDR